MDLRIDGWGLALLIVAAIIVPWLAIRSRGVMERVGVLPMPRPFFYWQSTFVQLLLYALALVASSTNGILLRLTPRNAGGWAAATALLAIALIALHVAWRFRSDRDRARLDSLLPHERNELLPFLVLCSVAAIAEEIVYRGVAYRLLLRSGVSMWIAIAILSLAFALAHSIQGWRSAAVIALFAAGFHAVVIYGGTLAPAIAAHFVYDVYAGLAVPRWMRK